MRCGLSRKFSGRFLLIACHVRGRFADMGVDALNHYPRIRTVERSPKGGILGFFWRFLRPISQPSDTHLGARISVIALIRSRDVKIIPIRAALKGHKYSDLRPRASHLSDLFSYRYNGNLPQTKRCGRGGRLVAKDRAHLRVVLCSGNPCTLSMLGHG
jgi:hypothetical protein